jgi:hypothetical protein
MMKVENEVAVMAKPILLSFCNSATFLWARTAFVNVANKKKNI